LLKPALDSELIELMTKAGFNKVFIGIETPNEASLKEAGKTNNLRGDLLQAVRTIHAGGLEVMGGFIVGFDHDTPDIFERQIAFIQKSGIIMAMVGLLDALPGTRLYKRLQTEGRLMEQTSGDNTDGTINFIPKMEPHTLQAGYNRVLEGIYAPQPYYERCLTFLAAYRPRNISKINRSGIMALFRSMWRIGIKNESGFRAYYWRLLFHSLLKDPRTLGEVVRLAIVGLHFRTALLKHATKRCSESQPVSNRPFFHDHYAT